MIRTIEEIPNVLVIQYDRFNNTTKKLQEDVKCKLTVNLNKTPCNLKGVIVHEGDNLNNGNYIGIFNFRMKTKYDNVFYIQDKQNADMLSLINQAYLLLFEITSPVITPRSQEISQDNLEQVTLSQPASCNLQSPKDTVLTQSQ